jgi:hypothetical protein
VVPSFPVPDVKSVADFGVDLDVVTTWAEVEAGLYAAIGKSAA